MISLSNIVFCRLIKYFDYKFYYAYFMSEFIHMKFSTLSQALAFLNCFFKLVFNRFLHFVLHKFLCCKVVGTSIITLLLN